MIGKARHESWVANKGIRFHCTLAFDDPICGVLAANANANANAFLLGFIHILHILHILMSRSEEEHWIQRRAHSIT